MDLQQKKAIKKCYNWTGAAMIFQLIIITVVAMIPGFGVGMYGALQGWSQKQMTDFMLVPAYLLTVNAISYLIANPVSGIIGLAGAHKLKGTKAIFQKSKLSGKAIACAAMLALGLQGLSILVQTIVTAVLHNNGSGLMTNFNVSFSDSVGTNLVILVYFIIIAPFTEEFLLRGMALRNLSVVNSRFAVIATALMFGMMHGNLMQAIIGFLVGLLLGVITIKAQSIRPAIICHMAINGNAMLLNLMSYLLPEEQLGIFSIVWMCVLLVIGVVFGILMWKKHQEVLKLPAATEEEKPYTWKLYFQSVPVLIFLLIYVIMIIAGFIV